MTDGTYYQDILDDVSSGMSVRQACAKYGVPESTFRANVDAAQYARAREACVESMADELLEIADDGRNDWMEQFGDDGENIGWRLNGEHVQRSKLRVDTRKWLLSKVAPKKYGDKVDVAHSGPDGGSVPVSLNVSPAIAAVLQAIKGGEA